MDIVEELHGIVAEQEAVDLGYKLDPTQWRLYNYLKRFCVGVENAENAAKIAFGIGIADYEKRQLRKDIRTIRTTLPRRIGSSSKGYWLMTSDDEIKGTSMMVKQFVSLVETLTQQGINPKLLHAIVGAYAKKQGREIDNQLTLKISDYLRDTIHTLSDDLKGE